MVALASAWLSSSCLQSPPPSPAHAAQAHVGSSPRQGSPAHSSTATSLLAAGGHNFLERRDKENKGCELGAPCKHPALVPTLPSPRLSQGF